MSTSEKSNVCLTNEKLLAEIIKAEKALKKVVRNTPLEKNDVLSERYGCNIYLKREDKQIVRSF